MSNFSDRMKAYEGAEAGRRFMPLLPIIVRVDSRAFHSFCKGLDVPFDARFRETMVKTAASLVEQTNAIVGYTQSDEISLIIFSERMNSQVFFDGRIQKMVSIIAAMTTVYFNGWLAITMPEKAVQSMPAMFDCRAWQVPLPGEAINYLIWREQDATRNSIQMAARAVFSHNECHKKNGKDLQDMLHAKGINWNDYPSFFKRGTYVQRKKVNKRLTPSELASLPPKHDARKNPDLAFERTVISTINGMPPLASITNRMEVIFGAAEPIVKTGEAIIGDIVDAEFKKHGKKESTEFEGSAGTN